MATSSRPNIWGAVIALGFILISLWGVPVSVIAFINTWIHAVFPAPLGPRTIIPWRTRWVSNNCKRYQQHVNFLIHLFKTAVFHVRCAWTRSTGKKKLVKKTGSSQHSQIKGLKLSNQEKCPFRVQLAVLCFSIPLPSFYQESFFSDASCLERASLSIFPRLHMLKACQSTLPHAFKKNSYLDKFESPRWMVDESSLFHLICNGLF